MNRLTAVSLLLSRPLLVRQEALEVMLGVASRGELFADEVQRAKVKALAKQGGDKLQNARMATVHGNMACIPVNGPLIRHADMFDEMSGLTSYEALATDLGAAERDPNVNCVCFIFGSPGGEAAGCSEMAQMIAECSKRTIAYIESEACSAAYELAAACDEVVLEATAMTGCLGAILGFIKDDAAMDQMGLKRIRFRSSQTPKKSADPESEAGKDQYQELVDDMAAVFIARVAQYRGVSEQTVMEKYGQGAVLVGQRALDAGLVDRLGTFEELMAQETARYAEERMNKITMKSLGLAEDATDEQLQARVVALTDFEGRIFELASVKTHAEAVGVVAAAFTSHGEIGELRARLAKADADGTVVALRAVLEAGLDATPPRLSLGRIQRGAVACLRGETRAAWVKAMADLKETTRESVLRAACSVKLTRDDVDALSEWQKAAEPVAAPPRTEPPRDTELEAAALDDTTKQIKALAENADKVLNRNQQKPAQAAPTK